MKVSLEWASDFVDLPPRVTAADVARELTLKTVEVEDCIDAAATLARVVCGQVIEVEPVGDRGYVIATCEVGTDDYVAVVTRMPSVHTGGMVAVALPGARLVPPGGRAPVEVTSAEVAGVLSSGVICTVANLRLESLFPQSQGGDALDLGDLGAAPGCPVSEVVGFSDFVLEIDNKSLTNRPDLWGHYGIARELAAIYGLELKPPASAARPPQVEGLVGDLDPDLCQRLSVVEFSLDTVKSAPLWLRSRLVRIGERSVNLCVDLSNYVMFTVGQPNHVYDADRISLPLSISRTSASGKLEIITGETPELEPSTPVVRDATGPVALAGIMGGAASAVSPTSHRCALEVATFRPTVVRRSSQRLALRTEASARFEKGLDTARVDTAVDLFLGLLAQVVPGATVSGMQDVELDPTAPAQVEVDLEFLTARIGQDVSAGEARTTLRSLGFAVTVDGNRLQVTAPTWRSTGDVSLPHDIVEEVARMVGFDNLPVEPLSVALKPVRSLNRRPLDRAIREQLASRAAMQEVVTYPWVADASLLAAGLSKDETVRFEGAPAPDRDALRPSLVPNLLEAVAANLRYAPSFRLFEVGTVFASVPLVPCRDTFEPLPRQALRAAGVFVGADGAGLFRQAKGVLEMLRRFCHLTDLQLTEADVAPWADRSARLEVTTSGMHVGSLGLLSTRCRRLSGIDNVQVACFELDLGRLSAHKSRDNRYEPIPELPEADFDLSVVVADSVRWSQIATAIAAVDPLISRVTFVDEFRGTWVPERHRSLTLRVTLQPRDSTLTADAITAIRGDILAALGREFGAYLRESSPTEATNR